MRLNDAVVNIPTAPLVQLCAPLVLYLVSLVVCCSATVRLRNAPSLTPFLF